MILEEPDERARWVLTHVARRCRPDGAGHGQEMTVKEFRREALFVEKTAKRHLIIQSTQAIARNAEEPGNVTDHPPVAGIGKVGRVTDELQQVRTGVFAAAAAQRHAEPHVRRGGSHTQVIEQGCEIRVGWRIEDDESGIDSI